MAALRRAGVVVVALCLLTLVAGWWSKARCLDDGTWSDDEQYLEWCYTDIFPLWFAERLSDGAVPYLDHPVEYPVLTGAQLWAGYQLVRPFPPEDRPVAFFHVTAALNALFCLGVLVLLAAAGLPRRRLLWWALTPTLAIHAFINWDALPVLLLTAAIVLHLRGRDLAAGVAAGLGTAAKLIPGVLVPVVVLARWAQGRRRDAVGHVAAALTTWVLVNLPIAVAAPAGWLRFFQLNRDRNADWDSLWFLAEEVRGSTLSPDLVNAGSALLLVIGAAVILAVGTRRRDPSQWWSLSLPLLVWFLLTNKVYSPQYSLWLIPLMALSLRGAAPFAAFLVADTLAFAIRFPYLAGVAGVDADTPGYPLYGVAILVRAAILLWILAESTLHHDPALTAGPRRRTTLAEHLPTLRRPEAEAAR
jgi:uncharacterized membrane protein